MKSTLHFFLPIILLASNACTSPPPKGNIGKSQSAFAALLEKFPEFNLELEGLPADGTDLSDLSMKVLIDPEFPSYSYRLNGPCEDVQDYRVQLTTEDLKLDISQIPEGDISLCLIVYHEPSKKWLSVKEAKTFSFKKIPFHRKLASKYDAYDFECQKLITTLSELDLYATEGGYSWSTNYKEQGCNKPEAKGEGKLLHLSTDGNALQGVWLKDSLNAGWIKIQWADKNRKDFSGSYGYGSQDDKKWGDWNTSVTMESAPAAEKANP